MIALLCVLVGVYAYGVLCAWTWLRMAAGKAGRGL